MLGTLVAAANLIRNARPEVHFLVPIADSLKKSEIRPAFSPDLPVTLVEGDAASIYEVADACDAVLSVSGTVTLQIALTETPMAVLYKMSSLTYAIAKRLVRVEYISLPNIVGGSRLVPEFIQEKATPRALADEVLRVLNDRAYAERIKAGLHQVRQKLGEPGCSRRVAEMLLGLVA